MSLLYLDLASRTKRLQESDLLSLEEAAKLAGTSRTTVYTWMRQGRCLGLKQVSRGFRLPAWQFEPHFWPFIEKVTSALGNHNGWDVLSYLESPQKTLGGVTPRSLIEQGHGDRLLQQLTPA